MILCRKLLDPSLVPDPGCHNSGHWLVVQMLLFVQLLSGMERRPELPVILGVLTAETQMTRAGDVGRSGPWVLRAGVRVGSVQTH